MEYICKTKVYTVVDFHNLFKDKLPQLVKVVQGYYGERAEDVFDNDQVFCIQSVSRQRRVISKFKATTHEERLFSIPSTYSEKLCIVRHGKVGKEKFLFEILRDSDPPLTVRFPRDRTVTVGDASVSSNTIPDIKLLQLFDEVHLLGDCINDGKLYTGVVHIPLYLSQLRLSLIKGIKEQTSSQWRSFQEQVELAGSCVKYDHHYGNPNIAEYDSSVIHSATATYTNVTPRRYTNMVSLTQRLDVHGIREHKVKQTSHQPQPVTGEHSSQLQPQPSHNVHSTQCNPQPKRGGQNTQQYPQPTQSGYNVPGSKPQEVDHEYEEIGYTVSSNIHTNSPAIIQSNTTHAEPAKPIHTSPIIQYKAPALPKRNVMSMSPTKLGDQSHGYANDVPRCQIQPIAHKKQISPQSQHIPSETSGQKISEDVGFTSNPNVSNRHEVSKLTINELIAYLNKLGLGQYEDTFRKQKIDGALLVDLDTQMLKDDLGMNSIEALKLIRFAHDGHVPV